MPAKRKFSDERMLKTIKRAGTIMGAADVLGVRVDCLYKRFRGLNQVRGTSTRQWLAENVKPRAIGTSDTARPATAMCFRTENFLAMLPPSGKQLVEILEYRGTLADHPLIHPEEELSRRQETRRAAEIKKLNAPIIVEVLTFKAGQNPQVEREQEFSVYGLTLRANRDFSRGDIEIIFSLGLRAMRHLKSSMCPGCESCVGGVAERGHA